MVLLFFCSNVVSAEGVWLLVDTKKLHLKVKYKQQTLMVLNNISIGRNGAGHKLSAGDDITPLGTYRIGWINRNSRYYRFFGFTYPSRENAVQARKNNVLDRQTYLRIIHAHDRHVTPPQNTVLGGQIGIHGLGDADIRIHKSMNWTHGCIALTNEQIDRLSPWIAKGTLVKVK